MKQNRTSAALRCKECLDILSQTISPHCELNQENALQLLVATVLSAQATDASVNNVTPALFARCRTAQDYVDLGEEALCNYIRSIGLYRNKAKSIVRLAQQLVECHQGNVPSSFDELVKLAGVGRKTANVMLNVWFKQPTIAVDTHVFRVANCLGIVSAKTPEETERQLLKIVPPEHALNAHHYLLLHGRYTCTARAPHCTSCPLNALCPSKTTGTKQK